LGEYPLFGLPAVLVPYPHAWQYQKTNAKYLTQHGAAVMINDNELATSLSSIVLGLMNDADLLNQMSSAMQSLARRSAADHIASIMTELAASAKSIRK
jgi:UDP-N-acetylglucosamine--N-acetylmuramyl-(pentapeptide) pyrophosphoryl-undecaprenol N-acetylglucosamine transferase